MTGQIQLCFKAHAPGPVSGVSLLQLLVVLMGNTVQNSVCEDEMVDER